MVEHPAPTGPFFEDLVVGDVYEHAPKRTVSDTDSIWFSLLTQNPQPLHLDRDYASRTEFGKLLVNSGLTLALVTGQSVADISINAFANLGWNDIRTPNPVFDGDTISSRSQIVATRESESRPEVGVVDIRTAGMNQHGDTVITFNRTVLVYKRGCSPVVRAGASGGLPGSSQ